VFITGLAHKYPLYSQTKEDFAALVNTLVPEHVSSPG
jgi:type III polyketide synthase